MPTTTIIDKLTSTSNGACPLRSCCQTGVLACVGAVTGVELVLADGVAEVVSSLSSFGFASDGADVELAGDSVGGACVGVGSGVAGADATGWLCLGADCDGAAGVTGATGAGGGVARGLP